MRYVSINNIQEGAILAKPLFDEDGRKLIDVEKPLTSFIINKLKGFGVAGLYVFDENYEDIFVEDLISEKTQKKALSALKNMDIDAVVRASKKITKELLNEKNLLFQMNDFRTHTDYTFKHSLNVSILSTIIGIGLGIKEKDLKNLSTAGLLHDIGKMKIDKALIEKPDKLTKEEELEMRKHPLYGYEMLKEKTELSATIKSGVYLHHENFDGTGYPLGVKGENIFFFGKIIHVADVYDALTHKRSYKEPFSPLDATEYLMSNCGTMFDLKIVETFLKFVAIYPKGTEVKLSDGRQGVIFHNHTEYVLRPIVKVETGEYVDLMETLNVVIV